MPESFIGVLGLVVFTCYVLAQFFSGVALSKKFTVLCNREYGPILFHIVMIIQLFMVGMGWGMVLFW